MLEGIAVSALRAEKRSCVAVSVRPSSARILGKSWARRLFAGPENHLTT